MQRFRLADGSALDLPDDAELVSVGTHGERVFEVRMPKPAWPWPRRSAAPLPDVYAWTYEEPTYKPPEALPLSDAETARLIARIASLRARGVPLV